MLALLQSDYGLANELLGESRGTVTCLAHFAQVTLRSVLGTEVRDQQVRVADDHRQNVVEIVGNPAGEAADGRSPMRSGR